MLARFFPQDAIGTLETGDDPEQVPEREAPRCTYCVPAEKGSTVAGLDECLIKMLGDAERKQVALTLYRTGWERGLFTKQCPMSAEHAYDACPFYEDSGDEPSTRRP